MLLLPTPTLSTAKTFSLKPAAPKLTPSAVTTTAVEVPLPDVAAEVLMVVDLVVRALVATSLVRTVAEVVLLAVAVVPSLRTLKHQRLVHIMQQVRGWHRDPSRCLLANGTARSL